MTDQLREHQDAILAAYREFDEQDIAGDAFLARVKALGFDVGRLSGLVAKSAEGSKTCSVADVIDALARPAAAGADAAAASPGHHAGPPKDHNVLDWTEQAPPATPPRSAPGKRADTLSFAWGSEVDPTPYRPQRSPVASPKRGGTGRAQADSDPIAWQGEAPADAEAQSSLPMMHKRHVPSAAESSRNVINWTNLDEGDSDGLATPATSIRLTANPQARVDHDVIGAWASESDPRPTSRAGDPKNADHDPVKWHRNAAPSPQRPPAAGRRADTDVIGWSPAKTAASDAGGSAAPAAAAAPATPQSARQQACEQVREFTGGDITKTVFFQRLEAIAGFTITPDLRALAEKVDRGGKVPFRQFVGALKVVEVTEPEVKVTPVKAHQGNYGDVIGWTTEEPPKPSPKPERTEPDPLTWSEEQTEATAQEVEQRRAHELATEEARGLADHVALGKLSEEQDMQANQEEHERAAHAHKTAVERIQSSVCMDWEAAAAEQDSAPSSAPANAHFAQREAERVRALNIFGAADDGDAAAGKDEGGRRAVPGQPDSMGGLMEWSVKEAAEPAVKTPTKSAEPTAEEAEARVLSAKQHKLTMSMSDSARRRDRFAESPIGWRATSAEANKAPAAVHTEELLDATAPPKSPHRPHLRGPAVRQHHASSIVFGDDQSAPPAEAAAVSPHRVDHMKTSVGADVVGTSRKAARNDDHVEPHSGRRRPDTAHSANEESHEKPKEVARKVLPHHRSSIIF